MAPLPRLLGTPVVVALLVATGCCRSRCAARCPCEVARAECPPPEGARSSPRAPRAANVKTPTPHARADDSSHVTSLQVVATSDGPEIVATLVSSDPQDDSVRVLLQWFDTGNSPKDTFETTTQRWSSMEDVEGFAGIDAAEFPNTNVRAVFEARDSHGNLRYRSARTITLP